MATTSKYRRIYRCFDWADVKAQRTLKNKICYNSKEEAEKALKEVAIKYPQRHPKYTMFCLACNSFHLTSKPVNKAA